MISDGKPFDTNVFFSGGAGMFIQYHDIVKPIYLGAIIKMIMAGESFGLPLNIINKMSILSMIEWYIKRRYKNPLQCLDYANKIDPKELDSLLQTILEDKSIYRISPSLNIRQLFSVYHHQHMSFPVYVYSEKEEPYIKEDCKSVFSGIPCTYLHGDLESCIKKCDQNFTYIFSDIELVKNAAEILTGTCSHILMASEYRYNYSDNCHTTKYDLNEIAYKHPFIRMGLTKAITLNRLVIDLATMSNKAQGGDHD